MLPEVNRIYLGKCQEIIKTWPDNFVDAVVTDPPYELGFMGKSWDSSGIAYSREMWAEVLRVLKPGGHLLAFGGTRTYHRMACAIEDAGFEIRDQMQWLYGSGFPKSHDISKAIDKKGGRPTLDQEIGMALKDARSRRGITKSQADEMFCGGSTLYSWYEGRPAGIQIPTSEYMAKIALAWPELEKYVGLTAEAEREVVAQVKQGRLAVAPGQGEDRSVVDLDVTIPATDAAKQWEGWGTALKPANEPICVARKHISEPTVAANVLKWGTGAINIEASRIKFASADDKAAAAAAAAAQRATRDQNQNRRAYGQFDNGPASLKPYLEGMDAGRWPANIILDEEAGAILDEQSGDRKAGGSLSGSEPSRPTKNTYGEYNDRREWSSYGDNGGASRFFYCAKTSRSEREAGLGGLPAERDESLRSADQPSMNEGDGNPYNRGVVPVRNIHPTVKPVALMRYLIRLVTPPNGIVLDPFMGSGTTGMAAKELGHPYIGTEMEPVHVDIAERRIAAWTGEKESKSKAKAKPVKTPRPDKHDHPSQTTMFEGAI